MQHDCIAAVYHINDRSLHFHLPDTKVGRAWASQSRALGRLWYQTFTNNDYNIYLEVGLLTRSDLQASTPALHTQDFMHRLPGKQHYHNGSADDTGAGGYEAGTLV